MRTLAQLNKYFKDNKVYFDGSNYNYTFNVGGKKRTGNDWWGNDYSGGTELSANIEQATFCCGLREMGQFCSPNKYPKHWEAILEFILRKEKVKYLRTETINNKSNSHAALDKALKAVGFRLVTTVPSGHNRDNPKEKHYKIKVWEWLKK